MEGFFHANTEHIINRINKDAINSSHTQNVKLELEQMDLKRMMDEQQAQIALISEKNNKNFNGTLLLKHLLDVKFKLADLIKKIPTRTIPVNDTTPKYNNPYMETIPENNGGDNNNCPHTNQKQNNNNQPNYTKYNNSPPMPPNNNYPPNNSPDYNHHHNGSQWRHAHSSRNHVFNKNNNNFIDPSFPNKLLPPIKEWTKFSGEGDYGHINFIEYINRILTVYRAPDDAILTRLPRLFEGVAFDWFISKQATMGQQSWPAWKELIKQQFGTRLWEKKMCRAIENDYFDRVKHNPHQWCLNQKKRIECIYPKLDQEQIND